MSRYQVTLVKEDPQSKKRGVIIGTRRLFPGQSVYLQAAAHANIAAHLRGLTIRGVVTVTEIPDAKAAEPVQAAPVVETAPAETPVEAPVAVVPAVEEPPVEAPADPAPAEAPAEEAPAAEPVAEEPATEAPAADAPAVEDKKPARRSAAPKFSA